MKNSKDQTKDVQSAKKDKSTKAKMYVGLKENFSSKESKKFRGKRRRILFNQSDAIISASLKKDKKGLKDAIKSFLTNYKSQYVLNDMSVESLYVGSNESKKEDLKRCLKIVQESLGNKK